MMALALWPKTTHKYDTCELQHNMGCVTFIHHQADITEWRDVLDRLDGLLAGHSIHTTSLCLLPPWCGATVWHCRTLDGTINARTSCQNHLSGASEALLTPFIIWQHGSQRMWSPR